MTKTILAADDSAAMRQILGLTLADAGYQVTIAEDGRAALAHALAKPYDLVLTDQNMPAMDGLTLIESLRLLDAYRATPILVLTTESSDEFKERARGAGATGWLTKPFEPATLTEIVAALLEPESA